MRILVISACHGTDRWPNSPIITGIVNGWLRAGHTVDVVAARTRTHPRNQPSPKGGPRVVRVGPRIVREERHLKLLKGIVYGALAAPVSLRFKRPDLIFTMSPPLTLGLTAWALARRWSVPYIYNVQDIYPDVLAQQGFLRDTHPLYRAMRHLEDFVYAHAGAVAVISEDHRANLRAKGVPDEKLVVIPNAVDLDFVRPRPKDNPVSRRFGVHDRFTVISAGNLGASQGLETLVECAALLQARDEDMTFLVVGEGTEGERLRALAESKALSNLRFEPFQPRADVPDLYAAGDVHVVMMRPGIDGSLPSKAYTILASGRPLLASIEAESGVAALVGSSGGGERVEPGDAAALAGRLVSLRDAPEIRAAYGVAGRRWMEASCDMAAVDERYAALLETLVPGG